jgi:hypothetical protein
MDWEAPVDAWYVWVGVAVVSVGLLGFVLGFPSQPSPDAARAVNAIDRVSSSSHQASVAYDHDAEAIKVGTKRVAMRNSGGTSQESVVFGSLTPVDAVEGDDRREALERIAAGAPPASVLEEYSFDAAALRGAAADARDQVDRNGAQWRPAEGPLFVRQLELGGERVVLVDT